MTPLSTPSIEANLPPVQASVVWGTIEAEVVEIKEAEPLPSAVQ
jgi:hypothetical protein